MCGIAGYVSTVKSEHRPEMLRAMADAMVHRGPDASGFYSDDFCGFAHRRLKILDLTDAANQPMTDEQSGAVLIFNGEIYNYQELRLELQSSGLQFKTSSDTEVLLKGLVHQGEDFIKKLEGDFSFCFRFPQRNELILARDRFGVKPLYIFEGGSEILFASEIKPLFAAGVKKEIDAENIAEFFRYRYVAGRDTLFRNIKHFPPGCFLKVGPDSRRLQKYYEVGSGDSLPKTFAESFASSVGTRLQADVKVGLFLSGGVDSSSIAAQAKLLKARVGAFTYSFGGEDNSLDEAAAAKNLAEKFAFPHHKISDPGDLFLQLPKIITALEEPLGDSIIMANYHLFEKTREHAGLALSGEGADEVFASYAHHRAIKLTLLLKKHSWLTSFAALIVRFAPLGFLNRLSPYPAKLNSSVKRRILSALCASSPADVYQSFSALFEENELVHLLQNKYRAPRGFFEESAQKTDFQNWLPKYGLLRIDKLSMAHSLEVRVPFLSHHVVASALARPFANPSVWQTDKSEFRRFCHSVLNLPASVRRQKKQPFFDPETAGSSSLYGQYVRAVLSPDRISKFGILNVEFVQKLLSEPGGGFLLSKKINSLLIFQIWCEVFFAE